MNKDKGKNKGSKPTDQGKVKDLPDKKLSTSQESSVKGGGNRGDFAKGGRNLLRGGT